MDDYDDFFSDDGIADLPTATLLELEQSAWAATQREKEPLEQSHVPQPQLRQQAGLNVPTRPSLLQRRSTTTSRGSRPTTSFGDAELQNLDAGVLDDGAGPAPAERQDVIILDEDDEEELQSVPAQERGVGLQTVHEDERQWQHEQAGVGEWQHFEQTGLQEDADYTTANYAEDNGDGTSAQFLAEAERLNEQVEQVRFPITCL